MMSATGVPAWLHRASTGAAVYVLTAGLVTLLGWILDWPQLTDWINSGISAFPNTVICAIFRAAALLLIVRTN